MTFASRLLPRLWRALVAALLLGLSLGAQAYYVSAGRVYDDAGNRLTLKGVNWFGFETETLAPHGLWARSLGSMLDQMKTLGFNAVRLPVCPATLRGQAVTSIDYSRNPTLQGLNSLQLLDAVVDQMDQRGLYVLLDHHRPDCQAISELWYTSAYTEAQWLADLAFIANRYKGKKYFLGVDLKNEPHGAASWGSGNAATDWNTAAEKGGRAVLAQAPNVLVMVEGISQNSYCTNSSAGTWWGGNIAPQACKPINLPANRLVLSPHVYGPDVFAQSYFSASDFPNNLPGIWDAHFGSVAAAGYAVVIGETGGKYGAGDPKDKTFQQALFKYLKGKGLLDLFYWSWNPNSGDTGGILNDDWTTVREDKMALLNDYWSGTTPPPTSPACSDGKDNDGDGKVDYPTDPGCSSAQDTDETDTTTPPPSSGTTVKFTKTNDWGTGYCGTVDVTNTGSAAVTWDVTLTVEGRVSSAWNMVWTQTGSQLNAKGVSWNGTLNPGATAQFGFCANR